MGQIKNRLKVILAERDMNVKQLSEASGVHYTTARRAVRSTKNANWAVIGKICQTLGIQPGDIFIYIPDELDEGWSGGLISYFYVLCLR